MPFSFRRRTLAAVLILLAALSSSSCTTPRVKLVDQPRLPDPPAPAECTRAALEAFAPELSGLPARWRDLTPDDRARALLANKADDTQQYQDLRDQAIRCAR